VAIKNTSKKFKTKFLDQILEDIATVPPSMNKEIFEIALDSRKVVLNSCFFSIKGRKENGLDYIQHALSKGAVAVVADDKKAKDQCARGGVPLFVIPELKKHLGTIARRFYDDPSSEMKVIGVTGTNGKTTIAYLLKEALQYLKKRCLYVGTLGAGSLEYKNFLQLNNTTPDIFTLNNLFRTHSQNGVTYCALEASSIGLDQDRLQNLSLDIGIFSNITQDHLDYHNDFETYKNAKAKLFKIKNLKYAIINIDDEFGSLLANSLSKSINLFKISLNQSMLKSDKAILGARHLSFDKAGCAFDLVYGAQTHSVKSRLIGRYNILNLLAVAAVLISQDVPLDEVAVILSSIGDVPGRMERCGRNFKGCPIYIDYAHTPDALENALVSLRQIYPSSANKLILVFGCGGDRDKNKRPFMGAIAEKYADSVMLTSDNSRNESSLNIIEDILKGIKDKSQIMINTDRELAINLSIQSAKENDVILIAGKGHEEYQEIFSKKQFFSDRLIIKKLLGEEL
tara:strand:- start:3988 stop:5523 length:1536 start_codon:yes stop_codon:yes gene_type:complete